MKLTKIVTSILLCILCLSACSSDEINNSVDDSNINSSVISENSQSDKNTSTASISDEDSEQTNGDYISNDELVDIALNISKKENNFTYWLFSPHDYSKDEVVQVEFNYTLNGEKFSNFCEYAPVSEYSSISDFVDKACEYLSEEYMENYIYKYIGLHPTKSIPMPLLKDIDGVLYKQVSIDGVSIIPNLDYTDGEVIEKTNSTAIVRLYVDSSVDNSYKYTDFNLIFENGRWKHNPIY